MRTMFYSVAESSNWRGFSRLVIPRDTEVCASCLSWACS